MDLKNVLSPMKIHEKLIFKIKNKLKPQQIFNLDETSAIDFFRSQNKKYQQLIDAILPMVEKAQTIADVGSNVGYFSLLLNKSLKNKNKQFLLFEPLKKLTSINRNLLNLYKLENFHIYEFGLGAENKDLKIFTSRDGNIGWNTMVELLNIESSMDSSSVQIRKFDDLQLPPPEFIKIDIEGYEYQALQGMMTFLKKHKPIMLIEIGFGKAHPQYQEVEKIFLDLKNIGYIMYDINMNPVEFRNIETTTDVILKVPSDKL